MSTASRVRSATVFGCMTLSFIVVTGCVSTTAVVAPPVEPVNPPPVVDQATIQAMGPPPGYVKPENYWVREKIILGVASEPDAPVTPKSSGKKGKKSKKAGNKKPPS
jgi:hypothetical protein